MGLNFLYFRIPKNQILVRLGQHDDSSGEDYPVIEIKRHAQYNPRNLHNDIALLKLGRRIVHDEHTGIVCLPEDDSDNDDHDGDKAILLGWQGIFGKFLSDFLGLHMVIYTRLASEKVILSCILCFKCGLTKDVTLKF